MPFRRPAEEKAKQARQRQVFIGAEGHEGHLRFNLVAELRLLLQTMAMFLLVTFVVLCWATSDETEIKAVVSSFGAVWTGLGVGRSFNAMLGVNNMTEPTSTSAILAITTTTDVPVQLTSNKAILATSTAMGPANQHAMTTAILATTTTNDLVSQSTSSQAILATSTTTEWTARATMSTAVLAKSTATEPSVQQPQTSSTAILAIPTTSVQQVGDPKFLTTINAILAKSTASSRLMENKIAMVIQRALVKSEADVEIAIERLEQLGEILHKDLGPTEVVDALQMLELFDDASDSHTDVLSLFSQHATSAETDEPKNDKVKHDPWWFEQTGYDEDQLAGDDDDNQTGRAVSSNVSGGSDKNDTMSSSSGNVTNSSRTMHADPGQLDSMTDSTRRLTSKLQKFSWAMKHRLHLSYLFLGTCLILASVGFMQAPRMQPGFGQRQNVGHGVGVATLKTPPGWSYENSGAYSLRSWLSDIVLWSTATDMEQERQAPAVALVIVGAARDLIREIPPQHLRDGVWEGGQHVTGLLVLCRTLAQHYAPLETELQTRAMSELMGYSRMVGETMDGALTRFEVLRYRAAQRGGFAMNVTAWHICC
jgi:hypothetical protein